VTDPVAALLGRLDRPASPRTEFADLLLERLLRELAPRPARRRRPKLRLAFAVLALLLVVAGVATATYLLTRSSAAPAGPVGNGPLAIVSGGDVSTIGPDGHLTPVWRCPAPRCGYVTGLAWAGDGRRLAIVVTRFGRSIDDLGLHVVDTRTRADRRISPEQLGCTAPRDPSWSPDSSRIAYACAGAILAVMPDGSDRQRVVARPGDAGTLSSPSWSPDGRRLVFALRIGTQLRGSSAIYVVNADGSDVHGLVRSGTAPDWSPDGTRIAYRAGCGGIKLITPDGRDVTPHRSGRCNAMGVPGIPFWSPDGTRLAIANHAARTTRGGIYVVNRDGSSLRLASPLDWRGPLGGARPAWRPAPGRTPQRPGCGRKTCL
jgi:hypothetical protein